MWCFGLWLIIFKLGDEQLSKCSLSFSYASIHFLQFLNGWSCSFLNNLLSSKTVISCIKSGFILEIRTNICCNRKGHFNSATFFEKSLSTFSIRLTRAVFKIQMQLWHRIPQVDFLSIKWKLVVTFRYVIINR